MEPHIIQFRKFPEPRGTLAVCEAEEDIPFPIKRVFWIIDPKEKRGNHSHKICEQVIVPIHGIFRVKCGDVDVVIQSPLFGVYIPTGFNVLLDSFSSDCVIMVLCSEHYDAEDLVLANETL